MEGKQESFKYPALDVHGQLDFVNLAPTLNQKSTSKLNLSTMQKEGGVDDEEEIKEWQANFK